MQDSWERRSEGQRKGNFDLAPLYFFAKFCATRMILVVLLAQVLHFSDNQDCWDGTKQAVDEHLPARGGTDGM